MGLQIRVASPDSSQTQVFLSGEVDLETVPELRAALEGIAQGKTGLIVLDLSELNYLGSVGVSVIIKAWDDLKANGKHLTIAGAHGPVKVVLEMLGLAHLVRQPLARKSSASNGSVDRTQS